MLPKKGQKSKLRAFAFLEYILSELKVNRAILFWELNHLNH